MRKFLFFVESCSVGRMQNVHDNKSQREICYGGKWQNKKNGCEVLDISVLNFATIYFESNRLIDTLMDLVLLGSQQTL